MIVFYGTRLYGKVDHVPGLFYVATHFAYVQFLPLFPTASYLILDGTEGSQGFKGTKISMSGKSVLIGYIRAALFLGALILGGFGIASMPNSTTEGVALIVAGLACGAIFFLSYKLTRPGPQRALRLAAQAGIEPEVVAKFFVDANLFKEGDHNGYHEDEREHDKV